MSFRVPIPDGRPRDVSSDELGEVGLSGDDNKDILNFVTNRFSFGEKYNDIAKVNQYAVRDFLYSFYDLMGGSGGIIRTIEKDGLSTLSLSSSQALEMLSNNPDFTQELLQLYLRKADNIEGFEGEQGEELNGYKILNLIKVYEAEKAKVALPQETDQEDYIRSQLNQIGTGFEPYFDHINAEQRKFNVLVRPGKFRDDNTPANIKPFQCRIGASTFAVPPTSVSVSQSFHTGSLTGGAIRQESSPKTNLGHSDTSINIQLIFPNHESIWGFRGNTGDLNMFNWDAKDSDGPHISDAEIDYYLSSLRGLITQFKYAPILPIRNQYINQTYGITAVTLNNLTVSTIENFPFAVMVNLSMSEFNYKPFMPMIQDFDQAIHWGKFRSYCGRAAARLDSKVNEGFLQEAPVNDAEDSQDIPGTFQIPGIPRFDKLQDIYEGKNLDLFYPTSTPARIFAPDTSEFRQPGENEVITQDIWDGALSSIGLDIVKAPSFNFFEYSNSLRRKGSEKNLLNNWLKANGTMYNDMSNAKRDEWIESAMSEWRNTENYDEADEERRRSRLNNEWYYAFFRLLMGNDAEIQKAKKAQKESGQHIIKEWEVPMEKLDIDWDSCIVQGVSVNMSNNFARMQIQMQESPTYQFIGGGDSTISTRMLVMGEENLTRIKRVYEHINGLARLEQVHGVLGFLGIRNILTSLCAVKYVLPNSFEVDTIPNMPHVYDVRMTFVDFDVRQQQREELSSEGQRLLAETFGKRNPFLRTKQMYSFVNAYPDLPLEVKDDKGETVGYSDPDWYFRSFITKDEDVYNWGLDDQMNGLFTNLTDVNKVIADRGVSPGESAAGDLFNRKRAIEASIRDLYETSGAELLPGFIIGEDGTIQLEELGNNAAAIAETSEMRQYLGVYGEDNNIASFIDFFKGGFFMLGSENTDTNEITYVTGKTRYREDLASVNSQGLKSIPGTVGLDQYQNEYIDKGASPQRQFESIMQDMQYREVGGRMLKAFPTYMLWLIDEGGRFASIKLFDNFYSLNSIIDFSVIQSQDSINDTLVLRLSNVYQRLTTPYREGLIDEDDPLYETAVGRWITTVENRYRNLESGMTDKIIELNNIRLKPGIRVHLRAGYGSSPNALQTLFNGVISEVQQGDIMTVVCQSDAVELTSMVNDTDSKGHSGSIQGGLNTGFFLSEPRDLIVRLMTMGTSSFKEWVAWGSKGVMFSESKFGIRHFGTILYETMNQEEKDASNNIYGAVLYASNDVNQGAGGLGALQDVTGALATDLSEIDKLRQIPGSVLNGNMLQLTKLLWTNSFANRDYELFKRNIYPGNGTGLAQYMGGDMIDGGIMMGELTAIASNDDSRDIDPSQVEGNVKPGDRTGRVPKSNGNFADIRDAMQEKIDAIREQQSKNRIEENTTVIPSIWEAYQQQTGLTDDELVALLDEPNLSAIDLTEYRADEKGLLAHLVSGGITAGSFVLDRGFGGLALDRIGDALGDSNHDWLQGLGTAFDITSYVTSFTKPLGTLTRVFSSPVAQATGFYSAMPDEDIEGYDEVSFRAQTYMKTVWDLLKVCAALLPNYIVAIRPFEERSTLFYGKPHWLYTSGVVPVSLGIPNDLNLHPLISPPDKVLNEVLKSKEQGFERLAEIASESNALKEIMGFSSEVSLDPNNVGAATGEAYVNPDTDSIITGLIERDEYDDAQQEGMRRAVAERRDQFDGLTNDEINALDMDDDQDIKLAVRMGDEDMAYEAYGAYLDDNLPEPSSAQSGSEIFDEWLTGEGVDGDGDSKNADEHDQQLGEFLDVDTVRSAVSNDPITFAWQFGWKFSFVPVWIDPNSGHGVDRVGEMARTLYDEDHSRTVEVIGEGESISEATDIWRDIRTDDFRDQPELVDVYNRFFPEAADNFEEVLDLFMRFLWQDPYNRAWVVIVVDRISSGVAELVINIGDRSRKWDWKKINRAFEFFITNEVTFDANKVPKSTATRRHMESNATPGKNASNIVTGIMEDASDWVDENIGQMMGLISDTLIGFVASIRLSLAQMSNALSMSGEMQRQSNILNAVFNDSIYYQMGTPDSLLRLVDNCFASETRYLTKDGYKTFEGTVNTKQTVLTSKGWKEAEIKSFGQQKLFKLTLSRGGVEKIIYTTDEHRWIVDSSPFTSYSARKIERLTKDLLPGQRLARCRPVRGPVPRVSPIGVQQGFVYGDGTRDRDQTIAYLYGEKDQALDAYFNMHHSTNIQSEIGLHGRKIRGLPVHWKEEPSLEESSSHLLGWLAGYFAADGCVSKNGVITLHSNTRANLEFVEYIANTRLGLATYDIRQAISKENKWRKASITYTIGFAQKYLFEEFFIIDEHKRRFNDSGKSDIKRWVVVSVEKTGRSEEVYCAVVPGVHDFCLESNILTGNCFTREYGEPVIEIREPFQRMHMISSFDSIIDNGIMESLDAVPTVVVAVSDGKNPVKVHFDKGIPPDRQVEKIVETGIYWDNAVGGGLFGIFHPLLHPFETARSYYKAFSNSSDQLSARRIALAHLKEGLKEIYQGEILMPGNPDIRPYDLLFIADIYCQPPGTKVRVIDGVDPNSNKQKQKDVNIEDIKKGDRVLSLGLKVFGAHSGHIARRGKKILQNNKLHFEGDLVKVETESGKVSRYTPNHKCIVRMKNTFDEKYLVYLMEKNGYYRVGVTQAKRQIDRGSRRERIFGLSLRMRGERADRGWILAVKDSLAEAMLEETLTAYRFGVPQTCFYAAGNRVLSQDDVDTFWREFGKNEAQAEVCLRHFSQSLQAPTRSRHDNGSFENTVLLHASFIRSGMEMKNEDGEWETITVSKEPYSGPVYTMEVEDYGTYLADGLFTHNSRVYGTAEVGNVIHHFTPDTGFVTSVSPKALVTVNDPARWTMLSYMSSKMFNKNIRNDVRTSMAINIDRNLASASSMIKQETAYETLGTQLNGAIQYTQGNSAIIKDISAMVTTGGIDDQWNQIAKTDILIGALKPVAAAAGAAAGTLAAGPGPGTVVGALGGWVAGDLAWEGWQWVKNNLLDQHGVYLSFLSRDGQPMDAGLSYYSGVAAGSNHTVEMLPSILGLTNTTQTARVNGNYRITTDDLLSSLGWSEVETTSLFRETSLYVNKVNSEILKLAGRDADPVQSKDAVWATAEILFPETMGGTGEGHIVDGDTLDVRIIDSSSSGPAKGSIVRIRFAAISTYELLYKDNPGTNYNETLNNAPNDLAVLAYNYLVNRFQNGDRRIAIRFDKRNLRDHFGRWLGVIFHNAPFGVSPSKYVDELKAAAIREPLIPWDSFLPDGRPYTLNWEMVMTGYGNVDMRDSLWNTTWRDDAVFNPGG